LKATSIVFLVISVILVISGNIMRSEAIKRADADNIELFSQELDKNGNLAEYTEFSDSSTNKINITLKDTDVNIIGNSERSYVEVLNFNAIEYSVYSNNTALNIENDLISSVVGRAEGGSISFNGVRDYVRDYIDKVEHNKEKIVNIYLSKNAEIKIFDIKLENGNINFENISSTSDYIISVEKGDVTVRNTPVISLFKIDCNKGLLNLVNTFVTKAEINLKNGNVNFTSLVDKIYNFDIEAETGDITVNNEKKKGTFKTELETYDASFSAHIGVGNINIKTIE